jgi:hypothetical protein
VIGLSGEVKDKSQPQGHSANIRPHDDNLVGDPENKDLMLVEAAGVEPASENVTGKETTCLVAFPLPYFYGNFRGRRSERTRNASH